MKNATIRLIIIFALLAAAGIIVTQTYWVRRAYDLQETEFNLNVNMALSTVTEDIMKLKEVQLPNYSAVERINPDYFVVQTNVFVEKDVLKHFLSAAFAKQNLLTDFQFGLYDCMSETVIYQELVHVSGAGPVNHPKTFVFPHIKRENYYFGVYFPDRKKFLTSQISIWMVSSLVLVCVLGFLAYLLFIIFRQRKLSEIQKNFVNNMTHELKTPLASIQMSANVLRNPDIAEKPQRLRNYADIILKESTQLISQVERVLQMAQSERGKLVLRKEPLIWQQLLLPVKESFDNMAASKQGQIYLHMPEEPVAFRGDALHLTNVLRNLVDNAIKYCDKQPEVHITLAVMPGKVEISVADNGIGIDKKYHKHIFEKFYRVPTGNIHNVKGFGLGLNYVYNITKLHHGQVKFSSEIGKGTIFTLSFIH
jgi:two-component system phosphate regulon sensor histidine kinase PhoR